MIRCVTNVLRVINYNCKLLCWSCLNRQMKCLSAHSPHMLYLLRAAFLVQRGKCTCLEGMGNSPLLFVLESCVWPVAQGNRKQGCYGNGSRGSKNISCDWSRRCCVTRSSGKCVSCQLEREKKKKTERKNLWARRLTAPVSVDKMNQVWSLSRVGSGWQVTALLKTLPQCWFFNKSFYSH